MKQSLVTALICAFGLLIQTSIQAQPMFGQGFNQSFGQGFDQGQMHQMRQGDPMIRHMPGGMAPGQAGPLIKIRSQWNGARVAFLGDSIIDVNQVAASNNTFPNFLEEILGIEAYVYGISGHNMSQIVPQAEKLEAEHGQAVDAIIVFVGTNDYNANIPLGEWYSYDTQTTNHNGNIVERKHRELIYDDSTFRGRTNSTMRFLKSHYPDKQIILLTPLHRGFADFAATNIQPEESFSNGCGLFIEDYVTAIKEVSNVWAVPVIDLNSISGLYPLQQEQQRYFRNPDHDLLHPNTPGQLRMACSLACQLTAYPAKFPKYIALSFDDGPNTKTTPKVLDVLEENGVRASFFVVGRNIDKASAKVMTRASDLGCDIENHSFTHKAMSKLTASEIEEEISKTNELIEKYTGTVPRFFRPPYIDYNELMHKIIDLTFINGYCCEDYNDKVSAETRAERILENAKDGDILLLHDSEGNDATVEALKTVIPELKKRGFVFVTVPELFDTVRGAAPKSNNGVIYTNVY